MLKRSALICLLATSWMLAAASAHALTIKPFTDADFAAVQKSGAPVAIHFTATWCPTCKAQEKSLAVLKSDPTLKSLTLLTSDYDQSKALQKQMRVNSQSTFVVFKGKAEVARSSGEVDAKAIKTLFAKAL